MQRRKRRPTSYDTFHENLRLQGYRDYSDYLHSETWKQFNAFYRTSQRLPQKCLACGCKQFILHHWTYERVTFENLSDVIPLCDGCHETLHRFLVAHKEINLAWVERQLVDCFGFTWPQAKKAWKPFERMKNRGIKRPKTRKQKKAVEIRVCSWCHKQKPAQDIVNELCVKCRSQKAKKPNSRIYKEIVQSANNGRTIPESVQLGR